MIHLGIASQFAALSRKRKKVTVSSVAFDEIIHATGMPDLVQEDSEAIVNVKQLTMAPLVTNYGSEEAYVLVVSGVVSSVNPHGNSKFLKHLSLIWRLYY
jgi:hypothetical protein